MQKRSMTLDSYELEEKIRKKDDQRLKLKTVQSRLWQKLRTLKKIFGFFWIGLKTKSNCRDEFVDAHRVNRGNLIPR
jgi:hypothetical protein